MENIPPNTTYDVRYRTHLYWGAIFAGALVALGLGFLLQLFGVAIGLTAYHADSQANNVALGGAISTIIGVIVSMGLAGFVAGYHGRFSCCHRGESLLYGFLTWSIALLLSALLILPLSQYASSYTDVSSTKVSVTENLPQNVVINKNAPSKPQGQVSENVSQTDVKVTPGAVAGSAWVIFILFFIGAVSSCVGAACGMGCRLKHKHPEMRPPL